MCLVPARDFMCIICLAGRLPTFCSAVLVIIVKMLWNVMKAEIQELKEKVMPRVLGWDLGETEAKVGLEM